MSQYHVFREVYDSQLKKTFLIHAKKALRLATSYPTRFSLLKPITQEELNKMPTLPPEREKLTNGTYDLLSESHQTTKGQYGDQEEISCINEATGVHCTIWIPHNSRPKILAAIEAGLCIMQGDEWITLDGVRFRAIASGGKVVAITASPRKDE